LENLQDAASQDLEDLESAWGVEQQLLQGVESNAQTAWANQKSQCDDLQGEESAL
jgi:hypothetical protein